jgi:hypothetical protein
LFVVTSVLLFGIRACWQAVQIDRPTAKEAPFEPGLATQFAVD